jgi:hypothetical protein
VLRQHGRRAANGQRITDGQTGGNRGVAF